MFDRGQLCAPVKEAYLNNIKLVMYGENAELEYGEIVPLKIAVECHGINMKKYILYTIK